MLERHDADSYTGDGNKKNRPNLLNHARAIQVGSSIAIAVFAFVQIGVNLAQWNATRSQYDAMLSANKISAIAANAAKDAAIVARRSADTVERTSRKELRAYVSVFNPNVQVLYNSIQSAEEASKVQGLILTIDVRNSGATMAHDVVVDSRILPTIYPFGGRFDLPLPDDDRHVSKFVSGPQSGFQHSKEIDLSSDDIDGVGHGIRAIWFFGEIRYRDEFDVFHVTKFRFIIGGNVSRDLHQMAFAADGNEAN